MRFLAAVLQMNSSEDKESNLECAARLLNLAAERGATLAVLPEMFSCLGCPKAMVSAAEPIPGPTSEHLSRLAARLGITIVAGSISEQSGNPTKVFNTSLVLGADGQLLGRYRKIHLFDAAPPGMPAQRESDWSIAGDTSQVVELSNMRLGLAICYDLRFGALFDALVAQDANVIAVPSAFTELTGRDHWEVLLRSRAIECQSYVVAANQYGAHGKSLRTYGRSMIVDPWGIVLASVADGTAVAIAEIDPERASTIRRQMPRQSRKIALSQKSSKHLA